MAASLGLNHGAYSLSSSSPFFAPNFPAAVASFPDQENRLFEYSPPPAFTGAEEAKLGMCGDEARRRGVNGRIGFRTESEVEILDDGFKWRKYGKKAVKNSPNPRNYYRCSTEGCGVKKRVERDRDDPRYVITTYDGVHNHACPGAGATTYTDVYCSPSHHSPSIAYADSPWAEAATGITTPGAWRVQMLI